jgi:ubiquinone/menaquinone biosynthesis C-methylase UbiE
MTRALPLFVATLALSALPAAPLAQGDSLATARIFDALSLHEGSTVCEIGAGDGALSLEAADRVGTRGHVYTSELGDQRVDTLRDKVTAARKPQVQVIAGDASATNFPGDACDALFMRNVYHHFETPSAMNRSIAAALKPGGRLAIVDFTPPGAEAPKPADRDRDGMHGVAAASVARELRAAGFHVDTTETGSGRWFMVVATKPES